MAAGGAAMGSSTALNRTRCTTPALNSVCVLLVCGSPEDTALFSSAVEQRRTRLLRKTGCSLDGSGLRGGRAGKVVAAGPVCRILSGPSWFGVSQLMGYRAWQFWSS